MKNKILHTLIYIILNILIYSNVSKSDQFNFDVTEIEILDNGNIIKGSKKGSIKTNDGITITGDTFIYNKKLNMLTAEGNVVIKDSKKNLEIYAENLIYEKSKEIITTNTNSKVILDKNKYIYANSFKLNRNTNTFNANGNVKLEETSKDYLMTGNNLTYFKDFEKIITVGDTETLIENKYKIASKDLVYLINENNLSSKHKTKIEDEKNSQVYFVENFNYSINEEILKGEKILAISNYNLPMSDKIFLDSAIINLNNREYIAKDTEIIIHKDIFNNPENDPRLKGVSSTSDGKITLINKGVFTSCKKDSDCPSWLIQAEKITHDKEKKQIMYDNAVLKIYDFPVFYLPKFFHPDPSVKRQSGLLQPELNNSNTLGGSLTLPYFKVISKNKDLTITPTLFDNNTLMSTVEYRQISKKSKLIADIGLVNGYKSSTTNKKNSLSHYFLDYDLDLEIKDYITSQIKLSAKKVSNNNYLKIFDPHITKSTLRPSNFDELNSSVKMFLTNDNFNFETGIQSYENLQIENNNDKYQYILPYYNFDKSISQNYFNGNVNFNSNGSNDLTNTNKLKTNVINNITYNSFDIVSNLGLKSNYGFSFKNLNSLGKKSILYKSSPKIELAGLFNADLSLPLKKKVNEYNNLLTPKLSFRYNPSKMKDYSTSDNKIDVNNIFALNRLGLSDTLESGKSITLGVDYLREKNDDLNEINDYFELKLATIFRDKEQNFIPNKTSINRKNSNLFGSIKNKFSDNLDLEYNFSVDNNYENFEYNDFNATISINNFVTKFNFIEENGEMGDTNVIANSIEYNLDDKNFFRFDTRRNRTLNLTEYYDLVYEYKNDCLTAGIKYKKSYYADGDIKPSENLLFTITLFPLTSYEYEGSNILGR